MYFDLLKVIIDPHEQYRIYIDIKDTRGGKKVEKLHEVSSNAQYDFARTIIERIQLVRSHEVEHCNWRIPDRAGVLRQPGTV